jgi:hypothetical protein
MAELLRLMLDSLSPFTNLFSRIHKVGVVGDVLSVENAARYRRSGEQAISADWRAVKFNPLESSAFSRRSLATTTEPL